MYKEHANLSASGNAEIARINAFVKENSSDRPIMRFVHSAPSITEYLSFAGGAGSSLTTTVSPIITGVAVETDQVSVSSPLEDTFVIWVPRLLGGSQPRGL